MANFKEQLFRTALNIKRETLLRLGLTSSVAALCVISYFSTDTNFDAKAQTIPTLPTIGGTIPEYTPTPSTTPTEVATTTPTVTVTPTEAENTDQLISVLDVYAVDENNQLINAPIVLTHPDGRVEMIAGMQGFGFREDELPTVFEVGPNVFASYGITDTSTVISGYAGPESVAGHNVQFAPSIYANGQLVRPDTLTLDIGEEPDPTARIEAQYVELEEVLVAASMSGDGLPTFTILQRKTEQGVVVYAISTGDDEVLLNDSEGTGKIDLSSPRQPGVLAAAAENDTNTFKISTARLSGPLETELTNEGARVQAELPVSQRHEFAVSTSGEIVIFDLSGAEVARATDENGNGVVNKEEIDAAIEEATNPNEPTPEFTPTPNSGEGPTPVPTVPTKEPPATPTTQPVPGEGETFEILLPHVQK